MALTGDEQPFVFITIAKDKVLKVMPPYLLLSTPVMIRPPERVRATTFGQWENAGEDMGFPTGFDFQNEADFLDQLIIPLLERLGFVKVARYHGTREFGKDVVFAEIDRFGHVRYHGLQAKYVPSLGLSGARELIEDCKQAFENPFTHPTTGAVERISCFYAANGGSISDAARDSFFNAVRSPFGGSVGLLDGVAIQTMDQTAAYRRRDAVVERLSALIVEVRYNRRILSFIELRYREFISANDKSATYPAGLRLRLLAVSAFLEAPLTPASALNAAVETYWHDSTIVNSGLNAIALRSGSLQTLHNSMQTLCKWQRNLDASAAIIEREARMILSELGFSETLRTVVDEP